MEEDVTKAFIRLETKVDVVSAQISKRAIADAEKAAELKVKVDAAHARIDDHITDHRSERASRIAMWATVGVGLLGSLTALFVAFSGS